jgi:hypothetical protein
MVINFKTYKISRVAQTSNQKKKTLLKPEKKIKNLTLFFPLTEEAQFPSIKIARHHPHGPQ